MIYSLNKTRTACSNCNVIFRISVCVSGECVYVCVCVCNCNLPGFALLTSLPVSSCTYQPALFYANLVVSGAETF